MFKKMTKGVHLLKRFAYDVKSLALFLYVRKWLKALFFLSRKHFEFRFFD